MDVQKSRDVPKSCAARAVGTGAGNTDKYTVPVITPRLE